MLKLAFARESLSESDVSFGSFVVYPPLEELVAWEPYCSMCHFKNIHNRLYIIFIVTISSFLTQFSWEHPQIIDIKKITHMEVSSLSVKASKSIPILRACERPISSEYLACLTFCVMGPWFILIWFFAVSTNWPRDINYIPSF